MGHFTVSKGLGGAAQGVINTVLLTQLLQCPAVRMQSAQLHVLREKDILEPSS